MKLEIYFVLIIIFFLHIGNVVLGQDKAIFFLSGDTLDRYQQIEIDGNWKYHPGNDHAETGWAQPGFDDSEWEIINSETFLNNRHKEISWFRFILEIDSTLWRVPLGLTIKYVGYVEVFLDGNLLKYSDKTGASREDKIFYIARNPKTISFAAPLSAINGRSRHLVAIRYSNFLVNKPEWSGSHSSCRFYIVNLKTMNDNWSNTVRKATFHQMLLIGVFLTFALLHLFLFWFYPKFRANIYFAQLAISSALLVFFNFQQYFITNPGNYILNQRLIYIAGTLFMLSSMRFTYSVTYVRLPRIFIFYLLIGFCLTFWSWFKPFIVYEYLVVFWLFGIVEIGRAIFISFIKKKEEILVGSWILGIGAMPLLLVGAYYFFIGLGLLPVLWKFLIFPTPYYAILSLMISMSVFLALNFARINKSLEEQIVQIEALSQKTLRQEIKRVELEAENSRKSKELEEARQLQLSMLPKCIDEIPGFDICFHMQTATEVGGDYYDYHLADDGTLTVAIGDATGHGMKAGTMVSVIKSLFIAEASQTDILSFFKKCTQTIKQMRLGNLYMAMMLIKIKDHKMTASSAGIPPIYIYRSETKSVEEIVIKGMPLGGPASFPYKQRETNLAPGDTVLLMSDGFAELFNDKDEMLDYSRVKKIFKEAAERSADEIVAHLFKAGERWSNGRPQDDDITFVVLKVKHNTDLL